MTTSEEAQQGWQEAQRKIDAAEALKTIVGQFDKSVSRVLGGLRDGIDLKRQQFAQMAIVESLRQADPIKRSADLNYSQGYVEALSLVSDAITTVLESIADDSI